MDGIGQYRGLHIGAKMTENRMLQGRRGQQGATLIEVLVAMVVIAVGLLGVAGLLIYTTKGNHSAYLRSQATVLAYDMIDTMRAAPEDFDNGLFDGCGNEDNSPCNYPAWGASGGDIESLLGIGATGTVTRIGNSVTVTINWSDARGQVLDDQGNESSDATPNADNTQSFEYTTEI